MRIRKRLKKMENQKILAQQPETQQETHSTTENQYINEMITTKEEETTTTKVCGCKAGALSVLSYPSNISCCCEITLTPIDFNLLPHGAKNLKCTRL